MPPSSGPGGKEHLVSGSCLWPRWPHCPSRHLKQHRGPRRLPKRQPSLHLRTLYPGTSRSLGACWGPAETPSLPPGWRVTCPDLGAQSINSVPHALHSPHPGVSPPRCLLNPGPTHTPVFPPTLPGAPGWVGRISALINPNLHFSLSGWHGMTPPHLPEYRRQETGDVLPAGPSQKDCISRQAHPPLKL